MATALVVGAVGVVGGFEYFYMFVPKAVVFPILVFIGLEITSQGFQATPSRHYPALVFACIPPLAFLAFLYAEQVLNHSGLSLEAPSAAVATEVGNVANGVPPLSEELRSNLMVLLCLKNGFVLTSLLWASMLAMSLNRKMFQAAGFACAAMVATLFGIIHSPTTSNTLFLPWISSSGAADGSSVGVMEFGSISNDLLANHVFPMAIAYAAVALLYGLWGIYLNRSDDGVA